jgi:predicted  nucleic acid-binding Zn-ribbon protein
MSTREAEIQKLKVQLDQWKGNLSELEVQVRNTAPDTKFHYEEQIKDLKERVEAAEQIYANIQEANEDSWGELREAAKTAWNELTENFTKAKSEFKGGYRKGLKEY